MLDLAATTDLCRLLADPTRVRLLALLTEHELTVQELTEATQLPQSRVSTHLRHLRDASLVRVRRAGSFAFHTVDSDHLPDDVRLLWDGLSQRTDDPLLSEDRERSAALVEARRRDATWAESVAGDMARHYSPGRTWEALTRGLLELLDLGRVLDVASGDGAVAAMVAPRARSVTCLDASARVVAAGRERHAAVPNLTFVTGDMHRLPFDAGCFDQALLMSALVHTRRPAAALAELARVLVPGGVLVGTTLDRHPHHAAVAQYDHVSHGAAPDELARLLEAAGFEVALCELTSRERRAPHLGVVTFHARRRPIPSTAPPKSRTLESP